MGSEQDGPILLATDFSEDAGDAFTWALDAARAFGAPLHVLHVVHDPIDDPGVYAAGSDATLEKLEDVARDMLDAWLEERLSAPESAGGAGVEISSSLANGLPETRILEVARRVGARMIVMGSLGQTGLVGILLGSRAEHVARRATLPVTLVRHVREDEAPGGDRPS